LFTAAKSCELCFGCSVAVADCQIEQKNAVVESAVYEEIAREPATNALDVRIESECVRIELPDGISKLIT